MSWSSREKTKYTLAFFILLIVGIIFMVIEITPATCVDGKRNQGEEGIDCGGPCESFCEFSSSDLIVEWVRSFEIKDNVYNAVAYITNPNRNMKVKSIFYTFKLYDEDNILVYERKGSTTIPSESVTVIFEPTIYTGNRSPKRTIFEFVQDPQWVRDDAPELEIQTRNLELKNETNGQLKITAEIQNLSLNEIRDLEVVAILFGKDGNAINSSRTIVNKILKDSEEQINFTWPNLSEKDISRVEILPVNYEIIKL